MKAMALFFRLAVPAVLALPAVLAVPSHVLGQSAVIVLRGTSGDDVAEGLPPGLLDAELMPGWITADGHRMTALRLQLEPGWKTYWRSPGDAGVPPQFDWTGSDNLSAVTLHWPRPEAIESGGTRTLGYHDALVLPIEVTPTDPSMPTTLRAEVDFGLCDDICVPARIRLQAPAAGAAPDPRITQALARQPQRATDQPECRIAPVPDGMRVTVWFDAQSPEVAMELPDQPVWVSQPELSRQDGMLAAQADFVPENGKPFPLDPAKLRLTLIGPDQAVEYTGCVPRD